MLTAAAPPPKTKTAEKTKKPTDIIKTPTKAKVETFKRLEKELIDGMKHAIKSFVDVGRTLRHMRDNGFFGDTYSDVFSYAAARYGLSKPSVSHFIQGSYVYETLANAKFDTLPANEYQCRNLWPVAKQETGNERLIAKWQEITATGKPITAELIESFVGGEKKNGDKKKNDKKKNNAADDTAIPHVKGFAYSAEVHVVGEDGECVELGKQLKTDAANVNGGDGEYTFVVGCDKPDGVLKTVLVWTNKHTAYVLSVRVEANPDDE